jgi:predicted HNH restriction endonuclease
VDQREFSNLFKVGEVIDSGGSPDRINAARIKILTIEKNFVRYQSVKNKMAHKFRYSYIDIVLEGFDKINPNSIQPSIQQVFRDAGQKKNYSTENYVYGFAREIRKRQELNQRSAFLSSGEAESIDVESSSQLYTEGTRIRITVEAIERSSKARAACLSHRGSACLACGLSFGQVYGAIGEGFIHVHHLQPVASRKSVYEIDPKEDLVPVCPNCHAMLHQRVPPFDVTELKEILRSMADNV